MEVRKHLKGMKRVIGKGCFKINQQMNDRLFIALRVILSRCRSASPFEKVPVFGKIEIRPLELPKTRLSRH